MTKSTLAPIIDQQTLQAKRQAELIRFGSVLKEADAAIERRHSHVSLIQKDRLPDLFSWRLTPADAAWAAAQRRDEQLPPEDVTD